MYILCWYDHKIILSLILYETVAVYFISSFHYIALKDIELQVCQLW